MKFWQEGGCWVVIIFKLWLGLMRSGAIRSDLPKDLIILFDHSFAVYSYVNSTVRNILSNCGFSLRHLKFIFSIIIIIIIIVSTSARQLLTDLGRRISQISGEVRESGYLFHWCSVLVQRFNAILLHDSLPAPDCTDWWSYPLNYLFRFF